MSVPRSKNLQWDVFTTSNQEKLLRALNDYSEAGWDVFVVTESEGYYTVVANKPLIRKRQLKERA